MIQRGSGRGVGVEDGSAIPNGRKKSGMAGKGLRTYYCYYFFFFFFSYRCLSRLSCEGCTRKTMKRVREVGSLLDYPMGPVSVVLQLHGISTDTT